jgi:hypothetical protein
MCPGDFTKKIHGKVGKKTIREPYHLVTWGCFMNLYDGLGFTTSEKVIWNGKLESQKKVWTS